MIFLFFFIVRIEYCRMPPPIWPFTVANLEEFARNRGNECIGRAREHIPFSCEKRYKTMMDKGLENPAPLFTTDPRLF